MAIKTRKEKNVAELATKVISIIIEGCKYFKTTSVIFSQKTFLAKLQRGHERRINRRQFNNNMRDLQDAGYIIRYKRHRYSKEKGYEFRSTRTYLRPKAWLLAARIGKIPYKMAYKMIAAIKKGKQRTIKQVEAWVTPDWMYEYLPQDLKPCRNDGT